MATVTAVQEFAPLKPRRSRLAVLPMGLLAFVLLQLVLLPAHWLPGHDALSGTGSSVEQAAHHAPASQGDEHPGHGHSGPDEPGHGNPGHHDPGHGHAAHGNPGPGHGSGGGEPTCHAAPHFADFVPPRAGSDELFKLGPVVQVLLAADVLALTPLLPKQLPRPGRWSAKPPWRPAGAVLLSHVCIARV